MLMLLNASIAPSTKAVYRLAYQSYCRFHNIFYPDAKVFPISDNRLATYVSHCAMQGLKGSTIQTHVAGLSFLHKMLGFRDLGKQFMLKQLLRGSKKLMDFPDQRLPITLKILQGIISKLHVIPLSRYNRSMYQSMFLTSFFGLFRVGELTKTIHGYDNILQFQNVRFVQTKMKTGHVILTLTKYKHASNPATIRLSCTPQKTMFQYAVYTVM